MQIVLLGDGKEKANLQAQAAEMELTNVTFAPSVPKAEMADALAAADACIAILKPLDEYKTTYPNKVFDYMAAGRPVVLAIDGVIREVVEAAGCGLFAEPGNPICIGRCHSDIGCEQGQSPPNGFGWTKIFGKEFQPHGDREEVVRVVGRFGKWGRVTDTHPAFRDMITPRRVHTS